MAQRFTSSATSINSAKLPAIFGKAPLSAPVVLDYGCGKHIKHIADHVIGLRKIYLPYDPYNVPENINSNSLRFVSDLMAHHSPVDVVCSNVLNVIDDEDTISTIAYDIELIVKYTGGTAYFTVYEGDRSGVGRQTGKDQYQRNEPLRSYLRFFTNATIRNNMIIVQ